MLQLKSAFTLSSLVALAVCIFGCGSSGSQKLPDNDDGNNDLLPPQPISLVPTDASKRAVMVVDDGFDLNQEVFKNKVVAAYTVVCMGGPQNDYSGSFVQAKRAILQEFAKQDTRCRIEKNIYFRPSRNFASIASYREQWNRALLAKDPSQLSSINQSIKKTISDVITGEDGKYNYHGTATAGTLSYNNENVQLILVQKHLSQGYKSHAANDAKFSCLTQAEVDNELPFYKDGDIQKAFIERPLSTEEEGIQNLIREHNVSLVNLSSGRLTRGGYEVLAKQHNCDQLDLREYFQTVFDLNKKRTAYLWEKGALGKNHLTLQAAGNDGMEINSGADAFDCSDVAHNRLLVGATDASGRATDFTNFGQCVDVFTMGDSMVVSAPQNFLSVTQGTSFSAPMLTRYLSKTFALASTPQEIVIALKNQMDVNKFLPAYVWPEELAWKRKSRTIVAYNFSENLQNAAFGFLTTPATLTGATPRSFYMRPPLVQKQLPRLW